MRLLFCGSGVAAHANEAIVCLVNARLNRFGFPGCSLLPRPFATQTDASASPVEDDPEVTHKVPARPLA